MEIVELALRRCLLDEGFGVLTEIDIAATLRAKLGVDRAPLKILGACNASLANEVLQIDEKMSLLLPCNVVLTESAIGTNVWAIDPMDLITEESMLSFAKEAADRLRSALEATAASC